MTLHKQANCVRLVSANLKHGGVAGRRPNAWTYMLEELGANVICAQESRRPEDYGVHGSLPSHFQPAPDRHWGSVVLAAWGDLSPILEVPRGCGHIAGAVLRVPGGDDAGAIDVYSVHVSGKGERDYLKNAMAALTGIPRSARPRVIAGDFNVTLAKRRPGEELANTPAELRMLDELSKTTGLVNVWDRHHPDEPLAQTLRWTGKPGAPYHCDGVFVDEKVLAHVIGVEVHDSPMWRSFTDHNAVVIDFAIGPD